ncbi:hypothetical protein EIN43_21130 [Enterobacter hormaechei]|uniref:Uncharacterized protein n=1 Tax=Enterobacter hormaechei TaxID=158836 RepID=A0A4Y5ZVI4_9ENTR|nr:hypothetical protein EIN43_21130 [Enterobacter hormaechei]
MEKTADWLTVRPIEPEKTQLIIIIIMGPFRQFGTLRAATSQIRAIYEIFRVAGGGVVVSYISMILIVLLHQYTHLNNQEANQR